MVSVPGFRVQKQLKSVGSWVAKVKFGEYGRDGITLKGNAAAHAKFWEVGCLRSVWFRAWGFVRGLL